jgi:ADP-heptose:LPS heptosyltransferase
MSNHSLPTQLQNILIVRLDNIGDVVMLGPAVRELRRAYPAARLTLLASPAGASVAGLLPWLDDVIVERAVWQDISDSAVLDERAQQEFIDMLAGRRFDAAFIFTSFSQSPHPAAYACYLAGIPIRVGQSKEFGGAVLSHWVRSQLDQLHQTERNLHLLETVGIPVLDRDLELAIPNKAGESADLLLCAAGIGSATRFVALVPGASCSSRRYPADRFGEAARLLSEETAMPVLVLGNAADALDFPEGAGDASYSLTGRTNVHEFAAIIARSSLVVCNNSSALHIADAFDRPVVATYSGTDYEEQWRPRRSLARILRRPTDCSPCYAFTCRYSLECLDIPPREVADNAVGLLQEQAKLEIVG